MFDSLESFDFDIDDDAEWDDVGEELVSSSSGEDDAKQLTYPYGKEEPQLTAEQLMELDGIADRIETQRLTTMGILLDAGTLDDVPHKQLSTRFVRGWRDKEMMIDGKLTRVWLRRSRFVAREFNWLSDDKQGMFSPAGSSISRTILPRVFLQQSR